MATNTPVLLKRFNGTDYDKLQPETTWTQVTDKPTTFTPTAHTHVKADITDFTHSHGNISYTGTWNNSPITPANADTIPLTRSGAISNSNLTIGTSTTTFLRNDGTWATPGGGERKFYNSISGTSGAWYDLFTVADGATGALFVSIQTYAHDDLLFTVGTGYSGSNVNTITILNCVYNPSGPYASITGVRVTNTGLVQAQFTWSSGPTVDIDVAVYGSGTLPTLAASLTANATSYTIDDTVSISGLQGKMRSENGFVQGTTPLPAGTGTTNEITYWSGTNTVGTLSTATYPSLTELSYVKGVTSAIQTQLNNKASSTHTHGNISNAGGWQSSPSAIGSGDTLVVTQSGLLKNTSLTFNTNTDAYLAQNGTWVKPTYTAYKSTQQSNATTTAATYHTITLPHSGYYSLTVYGMWSKTATTNLVGNVISVITNDATGTPKFDGAFEWQQTTTASAFTTENNSIAIPTSGTALAFTTQTATQSRTETYWCMKGFLYTGTTSDKTLSFQFACSTAPGTGDVALEKIAIVATKVG